MKSVDSEEPLEDSRMPLTEHLVELRKRLAIAMGGILVGFVGCYYFSGQIIDFATAPVMLFVETLQFDTLMDPFFSHVKAAFFASIFLTFPLTMSQIWLFVSPGLYGKEKKVAWPFLLLSYPLFVGGALFFYYFVFPLAAKFLIQFDPRLVPSLRIGDLLSNTVRLLFVFGLVFELPLISLLLTRLGMITAEWLSRSRRYSYVIIFIAAAVLTPPDPLSQIGMALPLIVLFEISIIVSRIARRRK